jgi:hypothetical protein
VFTIATISVRLRQRDHVFSQSVRGSSPSVSLGSFPRLLERHPLRLQRGGDAFHVRRGRPNRVSQTQSDLVPGLALTQRLLPSTRPKSARPNLTRFYSRSAKMSKSRATVTTPTRSQAGARTRSRTTSKSSSRAMTSRSNCR